MRALDRASRDQLDAAKLYRRAEDYGWRLLDCEGADSGDDSQRLNADVRNAFAAEERRKISVRTKEGLERWRKEHPNDSLGRPSAIKRGSALEKRIVRMRMEEGMSAKAIADALTAKRVKTPTGGATWSPSTVRRVFARAGVEA